MMREYVILTDTGADLPADVIAKYDIAVVELGLQIGETPVRASSLDYKEFYELLRKKETVTTSAANLEQVKEALRPHLLTGKDVLYLGFSSGLSSTYTAAVHAAEEMSEEFPDAKILCVDTLAASLGQGLLVTLTAKKKAEGATIDEAKAYAENTRLHLCHWFTVDDLFFLKRGGRVSAATAVLGSMLQIKPVMHVDNDGHLINVDKVRGRRASVDALLEKMKATATDPDGQLMYICHGDCYDDAKYLSDRIVALYPKCEVMIGYTGAVIGSHSGPGTLALFYIGTER